MQGGDSTGKREWNLKEKVLPWKSKVEGICWQLIDSVSLLTLCQLCFHSHSGRKWLHNQRPIAAAQSTKNRSWSNSFFSSCLQRRWKEKQCLVCKNRYSLTDPFYWKRSDNFRGSEDLCSLHSDKLKLFCVNHKLSMCVSVEIQKPAQATDLDPSLKLHRITKRSTRNP